MDGWMNGMWTDGWMDGWMDGTPGCVFTFFPLLTSRFMSDEKLLYKGYRGYGWGYITWPN